MAVQYLLPCPKCKKTIPVVLKQAGQELTCEHCGHSFEVPKLGKLKQLEAFEEQDTRKRQSKLNPLQAWLFAAGLVIAVVAGTSGAALYAYGDTLIADIDIDQEIEQQLAYYDEFTPAQLYDVWKDLNADELGDWKENVTIRYNKQGRILQGVSYGVMGLSGLGLLMLISSFFVGSGRR